jgi:hypothetical protein
MAKWAMREHRLVQPRAHRHPWLRWTTSQTLIDPVLHLQQLLHFTAIFIRLAKVEESIF